MTDYDPLRSLREELAGLNDILSAIKQRERTCEAEIAAAESELNAVRKLVGFARIEIEKRRAEIRKLEQER
jgi:septal ring factor EnvC (AmiA/AmiB activator)